MGFSQRNMVKTSGICGMLAGVVAFAGIAFAIISYPQFSWQGNALSDLGVVPGITSFAFNYGIIASGVLMLAFACGLFFFAGGTIMGKIGAVVAVFLGLSLAGIGAFTESSEPFHYAFSISFFIFLPLGMLCFSAEFSRSSERMLANLSLAMAFVAIASWVFHLVFGFGQNVAIPEIISAAAVAIWVFAVAGAMGKKVRAGL